MNKFKSLTHQPKKQTNYRLKNKAIKKEKEYNKRKVKRQSFAPPRIRVLYPDDVMPHYSENFRFLDEIEIASLPPVNKLL